ncbi:MAG: [Fe-Fe] hydrogenase large subunit C-terminal domain-containing protein [Planctomycetota bacterium]
MGIVSTIPEKCKRCYTCVRECPAKAIKVEGGQAMVIEDRCIVCGNCVKVCAQQAKLIEDSTEAVKRMLAGKERVFACIAPSFPAAFHPTAPGKIIAATRALGFHEVWEVAFGAELLSREYGRYFETIRDTTGPVVTTPCPAIVAFVEKYVPSLHTALAPIVSPMIAIARAIRHRHGEKVRVVFIGPCIAKKNEIRDPKVAGTVDAVLTYKELVRMLDEAGIGVEEMPESGFDGPRSLLARSFPISGGLLKSAGLSSDILDNEIVVTEGKDRVLDALQDLAEGKSHARLFDVLFCEGCINGPKMLNDLSVIKRKEVLADFVNEQNRFTSQKELVESLDEFKDINLRREFTRQDMKLPIPTEEEINRALMAMKKFAPEDQLNCGACGYRSCREKAIAVCQGLAEAEMCLPYLVDELQTALNRVRQSHEELASAQARLVQTEKLASMGQLSAGVAHEINNPLGTILIYSHMLLKQLQGQDERRPDLEMIVNEATRCKDIVRGLLDFARQSRVSKSPVNLSKLIDEVMAIMGPKAEAVGVKLTSDISGDLPTMFIDATQIKQMLINLIQNGIDAVEKNGHVSVTVGKCDKNGSVEIRVADNGCGISKENQSKLFTPFFTTKAMGKGTGLGLAIAYGVVKMHSGDISVDSEEGRGTTFTIRLPTAHVGDEAATVSSILRGGADSTT